MQLSELLGQEVRNTDTNVEIRGLTADSRAVRPGYLFAALPGVKADGAQYIGQAISRGAVAVLAGKDVHMQSAGTMLVSDENPRQRFAFIAARFFSHQPAHVVAVTGTSGKTSVVSFARQLWSNLGRSAASLGTLGVIAPDYSYSLGHTTPDPVELHGQLATLAKRGVSCLAMEASSHGLDQFRLDGVKIEAAAFTNLSHDHLDYHPSMDAYLTAKLRLFRDLLPVGGTAVINADAPISAEVMALCHERQQRIVTYGINGKDLRLISAVPHGHGHWIEAEIFGKQKSFELPLAGSFQVGNALAAFGLVAAVEGYSLSPEHLSKLEGVPGRMQLAAVHPNGAPIYVDYAHKPDALTAVLSALRPHVRGRLIVVFGCGGDRDRAKRPMMGAIAARTADIVIVTDDNPRSEDPSTIRAAICATAPEARNIGDRKMAIQAAIDLLRPDDLLLIAGKGHERGQIIGATVHPFDDVDVVRGIVAGQGGGL